MAATTQHLAVLKAPYLDMFLDGRKRIECRLLKTARPPFEVVKPGQVIWLKRCGKWIEGCGRAARVLHLADLAPGDLAALKQRYNDQICAQDDFWEARRTCRYAALIWLDNVRRVPSFNFDRQPTSPWVVLHKAPDLRFELDR